ncbi:MAG: hypothetical protein ACK42Z_09145, partial [Candidatus Kapaibacteriota bacterium]
KRFPRALENIEIILKLLRDKKDEAYSFNLNIVNNALVFFPSEIKQHVIQYLRLQSLAQKEHTFAILPHIIWIN